MKLLVNVSGLPDVRFVWSKQERVVLGAFGKPVWTWPAVIAADVGPMQIQLREGVSVACAEAAVWGATQDTGRSESGWD